MDDLNINGISLSHQRLVELFKLSDSAEPYFRWLEGISKSKFNAKSFNDFLMTSKKETIIEFVREAQKQVLGPDAPQLFDGIGRPYKPRKGLYFILGWIVRDAPQQRLQPILTNITKSGIAYDEAEQLAFASLVVAYRINLKTFEWQVIREVIADRLEGSRRSLKGKAIEAAVRTSVANTFAGYFTKNGNYGRFRKIEMLDSETLLDGHAFDVCINLYEAEEISERIVMPVKSRETQGGGHANLFTRDIEAAMTSLKKYSKTSGIKVWFIPVIVAENWHSDQISTVSKLADELIVISDNPNSIESLPLVAEEKLKSFLESLIC